eukprot:scaffold96330_cov20-Tisochrysis_lutea.AAC.1
MGGMGPDVLCHACCKVVVNQQALLHLNTSATFRPQLSAVVIDNSDGLQGLASRYRGGKDQLQTQLISSQTNP